MTTHQLPDPIKKRLQAVEDFMEDLQEDEKAYLISDIQAMLIEIEKLNVFFLEEKIQDQYQVGLDYSIKLKNHLEKKWRQVTSDIQDESIEPSNPKKRKYSKQLIIKRFKTETGFKVQTNEGRYAVFFPCTHKQPIDYFQHASKVLIKYADKNQHKMFITVLINLLMAAENSLAELKKINSFNPRLAFFIANMYCIIEALDPQNDELKNHQINFINTYQVQASSTLLLPTPKANINLLCDKYLKGFVVALNEIFKSDQIFLRKILHQTLIQLQTLLIHHASLSSYTINCPSGLTGKQFYLHSVLVSAARAVDPEAISDLIHQQTQIKHNTQPMRNFK